MNTSVENYLLNGCGRCPVGGSPDCKVHQWTNELKLLRSIVLKSGLSEDCKWGVPCYTYNNKNVVLISALKDYCSISFFKGSLLKDSKGLLEKPGPNSQAARLFKFVDTERIKALENDILTFLLQAIEIEEKGLKVTFKTKPEPIPKELEDMFQSDPLFKTAFESLTPGRQRGYIIYFSGAKQSKTRISRIEKCIGKILNGEGMHDKYQRKSG